jgi:DNA-binding LytR/AlgR family response regulator
VNVTRVASIEQGDGGRLLVRLTGGAEEVEVSRRQTREFRIRMAL